MLKQRQQVFVSLLAIADTVVIIAACIAAWFIRRTQIDGDLPALSWPQGVRDWIQQPLLVFTIPIAITAMRVFGLYRPWRDKRMLAEAKAVLNAAIATVISLIVLLWGLGPDIMGGSDPAHMAVYAGIRFDAAKLQLVALALLLPAALIASRAAFRVVLRELRRRGRNLRHVAIIGTGRLARIACRTLERNSWTGLHVDYFVAHHEPDKSLANAAPSHSPILNRAVLGSVQDLERILERRPVDAVYLAIPNTRAAMIPTLLRRLEKFPVDVRIIPDVTPRYTPLSMTINELEGMPILSIRENPMAGVAGAVKRSIDILGSILCILLFTLPMLLIAALIKLSSPGPAIFRQRRVSVGGEEFNILKFRTMHHADDEQGIPTATWTAKDDPRVTPIGRFLRKVSLDELPQLFNVLLGDMSLVGPRPERPELIAKFREDWRGYMLRQHVKAGMTGWAQVNGHRGDTGLRKRLQHDLFYIRHWSLAFDLKILWLTLFRGFVHRNAH